MTSFRQVLGTPLFWWIGFGNFTNFLASRIDLLVGSFLVHVSGGQLSKSLCGGLTTGCTLGLVYGLQQGKVFYQLPNLTQQINFLRRQYRMSVMATVGLAGCALPLPLPLASHEALTRAVLVAICSGLLCSAVAFQFFQIPGMVLSQPQFAPNKPIFFALLDALGYFGSGPVFRASGLLVDHFGAESGWLMTWILMALLLASGAVTMLKTIHPILQQQQDQQKS